MQANEGGEAEAGPPELGAVPSAAAIKSAVDAVLASGDDPAAALAAMERMVRPFLERPAQLDPLMPALVRELCELLRSKAVSPSHIENARFFPAMQALHVVIKTRGFKPSMRHLPHEVGLVEPAVALFQSCKDAPWEVRYVILLWLSVLMLEPFNFEQVVDSTGGLASSIIDICNAALKQTGPIQRAASLCLARLLIRQEYLGRLAQTCDSALEIQDAGSLCLLVDIFKYGPKSSLSPLALCFLPRILSLQALSRGSSSLERKLCSKLAQRACLVRLPVRLAAWRYQRSGRRPVLSMHSSGVAVSSTAEVDSTASRAAEEPIDQASAESAMRVLLSLCCDRDTVVRWSAAKGVGRIGARLPAALANEVALHVLRLFSDASPDTAWHGGTLALAELARRGALLPSLLGQVTAKALLPALAFDRLLGARSVGGHVRDAACYLCWAFARAFDGDALKSIARDVSTSLLLACVFDREVNCRRAAAAAYQECVGRLGPQLFPFGIAIIAQTDMLALASLERCYSQIAANLCSVDASLTSAFVRHIVEVKSLHWDSAIQTHSAKTVQSLLPLCTQDLKEWTVAALRSRRDSGALACASVLGDSGLLAALVAEVDLRRAVNDSEWLNIISAAFSHRVASVVDRNRLDEVVLGCLSSASPEVAGRTIAVILEHAPLPTDAALAVKLAREPGGPKALVFVPSTILKQCRLDICRVLSQNIMGPCTPEYRRDALLALGMASSLPLDPQAVEAALKACLWASTDYRSDERGDVGSWSRAAALHTMESLAQELGWTLLEASAPGSERLCLLAAARLACERIDAVRFKAVSVLCGSRLPLGSIVDLGSLHEISTALLRTEVLRAAAVSGLVSSVGGVIESSRLAGEAALQGFLGEECTDAELGEVLDVILQVMRAAPGMERVQTPALRTLAFCFESCNVLPRAPKLWCRLVGQWAVREVHKTKSTHRLLAAGRVLVALAEQGYVGMDVLEALLGHAFPSVRAGVADACYVWLMAVPGDQAERATEVLAETRWQDAESAASGLEKWKELWRVC